MTIESGQRIALVGQPRSGKSTLSKIPSGLYKIDTGKVLFGGVNINQIDKKILSQNLRVVPQDSFLLNRSILDNITLKHEVTSQKIEEVCKAVQINEKIANLNKMAEVLINLKSEDLSSRKLARYDFSKLNLPKSITVEQVSEEIRVLQGELDRLLDEYDGITRRLETFVKILSDT